MLFRFDKVGVLSTWNELFYISRLMWNYASIYVSIFMKNNKTFFLSLAS